MYANSFADIVGEGLFGRYAGLMVSLGLQVPGVRILTSTQIGPDTYRVAVRSSILAPVPIRRWVNGRAIVSAARSMVVTAPGGENMRLDMTDDPDAWPPFEYANTVELQWEAIAGVATYRIKRSGIEVYTVRVRDDRFYFTWTSAAQEDTPYWPIWQIVPVSAAGVEGPAADQQPEIVTWPSRVDITWSYDDVTGALTIAEA